MRAARWPRVLLLAVVPGLLIFAASIEWRRPAALFQIRETNPRDVTILVDANTRFQVIDGFGHALASSLVHAGEQTLSDSLRRTGIEKAFHEVRLNLGIVGTVFESPSVDYNLRRNDNADPFTIDWGGFNSFSLDAMKHSVVDLAKPYGYTGYALGGEAPNVRWGSPWLAAIRAHDYSAYLDEAAEQVLATVSYWKKTYGEEPPYYELGNEQLSGNKAMSNPDVGGFGSVDPVRQMVDVTARAGARLRKAGFTKIRFIVGTEETEEVSLKVAGAILSDADARQYVGVIGYHSYPYHEGYSSVPFILRTSGAGRPDEQRVAVRNRLRDLGEKYKVKIWLDENSHAGHAISYDTFRGRAIQIHDEFLYANASAYFVEAAMWDLATQRAHFRNSELGGGDSEGNAVLIHNDTGAVDITGIGYAVGHYARWVKPGAVRVKADSGDPLVQVSAFRNPGEGPLTLVLINNAGAPRQAKVRLRGLTVEGNLTGEQSTESAYWKPIQPFAPASADSIVIMLPPESVTSVRSGM